MAHARVRVSQHFKASGLLSSWKWICWRTGNIAEILKSLRKGLIKAPSVERLDMV